MFIVNFILKFFLEQYFYYLLINFFPSNFTTQNLITLLKVAYGIT